jgi:hypothetical protein
MASGVKEVYERKLKGHKIQTLGELASLTDETMRYIAQHPDRKRRIPLTMLTGIVKTIKARLSQEEKPSPLVVKHTKEANPYKSKFGEDEWEQRLRESSGIHRYRSVMDLAEYMVAEGYRLFPDGNFWLYHDALSLLTAKQTRREMQEKGYLKHWVLPELGLNKKTIYAERPPGNSPEMMPWDCSLNNDLVEAVMRHVSVCSFASRDEVQKFKLTSPKDVTQAYEKLLAWGGEEDGMRRGSMFLAQSDKRQISPKSSARCTKS